MSRPQLVLLHGFAGRPESWRDVIDRLPPGLEPLPLELFGHAVAARDHAGQPADDQVGGTFPGRQPSFETELDRLAGQIRRLASGPVWLAGYSLGARLALGLLVRHAGSLRGAVLLGGHPGLEPPEERAARLAEDEAWARRLDSEGLPALLGAWQAQPLFATQTAEQREQLRRQRLALDPAGLSLALRHLGLGAMPNYWPDLCRIERPVAWAAGEADEKFLHLGAAAAAACPRGSFHTIARAGHNVVLENPAAVAALLTTFTGMDVHAPAPRERAAIERTTT